MYPYFSASAPRALTTVLKRELDQNFSRRKYTLAGGSGSDRVVQVGQVLGRRLFGTPTGAAGTNSGNGGIGSISLKSLAKLGTYSLVCVAAATNGGRFSVVDPDGIRLADALVGVAYVGTHLGLTISDGTNDFVVGDSFTVTVPEGDKKLVPIDFSAVDGTQRFHSIAADNVTAPNGTDMPIVSLRRGVVVAKQELIWPAGATDTQKTAALTDAETAWIFAFDEA